MVRTDDGLSIEHVVGIGRPQLLFEPTCVLNCFAMFIEFPKSVPFHYSLFCGESRCDFLEGLAIHSNMHNRRVSQFLPGPAMQTNREGIKSELGDAQLVWTST